MVLAGSYVRRSSDVLGGVGASANDPSSAVALKMNIGIVLPLVSVPDSAATNDSDQRHGICIINISEYIVPILNTRGPRVLKIAGFVIVNSSRVQLF